MPERVATEVQGPPAIEGLVGDYLAACRAKGLSPKTIKLAYGNPLKSVLVPWCGQAGIVVPSDLTTRLLERFSADLMDNGGKRGELSRNTVWSYVKAVRGFLAWAKAEGEEVDAEARLPKLPQRHIEVLTRDEVQRIEDVADSERDKLIVRLLADTDVRVGELVKLRERDLVEQSRTETFLRVVGRSDEGRTTPAGCGATAGRAACTAQVSCGGTLAGYGVRISDELNKEIGLQPDHVRDEFWVVHDQMARFGAPRSIWYGQPLQLPLPLELPGNPMTRPFGSNGAIVFKVVSEHEVEILKVEWPTALADLDYDGAMEPR